MNAQQPTIRLGDTFKIGDTQWRLYQYNSRGVACVNPNGRACTFSIETIVRHAGKPVAPRKPTPKLSSAVMREIDGENDFDARRNGDYD